MVQLYVVSVVSLAFSGTALASSLLDEKISWPPLLNRDVLNGSVFSLLLGLVTFIAGFLQFLLVPFGDIAVIGNLFPALGGIIAGFTLGLLYYRRNSTVDSEDTEHVTAVFIANRDVIGVLALLIATLHFLFPSFILL